MEVQGIVPKGHYSKKEMIGLRDNLRRNLFSQLEDKVAKILKNKRSITNYALCHNWYIVANIKGERLVRLL